MNLLGLQTALMAFGIALVGISLVVWRLVRNLGAEIDFHERELNIIRQSTLFHNLPIGPSMQAASCLECQNAEPGEEIVRQGDEGDDAYLIGAGRLKVFVDGKAVTQLGPGDDSTSRALPCAPEISGAIETRSPRPRAARSPEGCAAVGPSPVDRMRVSRHDGEPAHPAGRIPR